VDKRLAKSFIHRLFCMFRAKKSLGQNFLVNQGILDKIINAADLNKKDIVLEIGSGTGVLTKKLTENAGRIVAVEKDRRLIEELREKFRNTNIEIVEGDILKFQPTIYNLKPTTYKVVGNIPYYLTSNLLRKIFEDWPQPKLIILTMQKEVAQRIIAKPPRMNLLALSIQFYTEPKIISYVSRGSFRPMPKVDSAIIRLTPYQESRIMNYELREKFFKLTKTAFAGKRKQLKNTIGAEILEKTGLRPESRPEELSLEDWLQITSQV